MPALVAFAVLPGGCYWSSPSPYPYGHSESSPDDATPLATPPAPALSSARVIILGRFDTVATQPIGGLYDWSDYDVSPLFRTYFFKYAHLELFEHACDALRATGLDIRKDYATTGEPTLVEAPLRSLHPLIVRTQVLALQHDQVRTDADPPADYEVVRLRARVEVLDLSGAKRYDATHEIHGRMDAQDPANLLRVLGLELGARLARDPAFLKALEASPKGAS